MEFETAPGDVFAPVAVVVALDCKTVGFFLKISAYLNTQK